MQQVFRFKKEFTVMFFLVVAVIFGSLVSVSGFSTLTPEDEGLITSKMQSPVSKVSADGPDRYYVVFKNKTVSADESVVTSRGASIRHRFNRVSAFSITVPNESALNAIKNDPGVEYVEKVSKVTAIEEITPWGISAVHAPLVWNIVTGHGVGVCVVDSGIDYNHPDLDDLYAGGWDFVNNDNDPWDDFGHGTHCAGTVAAETNGLGVIGASYDVTLYAAKVLDDQGSGWSDDVMAGVQWAWDNGAQIASLSLGGPSGSPTEQAFYQSIYDDGLLVICASGNAGTGTIDYPARYSSTVCVGSVGMSLIRSTFSQYGPQMELVAPGEFVLSTVPLGTGYETYVVENGTPFESIGMTYAGYTDDDGITATAYYCNYGQTPADFPPGVNGNIALIQRGSISFADKVTNAMNAGAVAVIIYNNAPGLYYGTLGSPGTWVPAVSMSNADGETLRALGTPTVTYLHKIGDYDYKQGTSMATPHVSGVAALVMQANGTLTNVEVRELLNATATDLGDPGWDQYYGNGLVDAQAAIEEAIPDVMFISSIRMELVRVDNLHVQALAHVKVVDFTEHPVSGATVYGVWSGCVQGRARAVTGNNGVATLRSPLFNPYTYLGSERPCFIINITDIRHGTLQYAPEMNKVPPYGRICY
jgi:serine protease